MRYIINGYSPEMLKFTKGFFTHQRITEEEFYKLSQDAWSVIGNKGLANILNVAYNRESISMNPGDEALIVIIRGGKLPKGAKKLPEDIELVYYHYKLCDIQTNVFF